MTDMNSTAPLPPQPPRPSASRPEQQTPAARSGSKALAITISVIGGLGLVVTGTTIAFGTVHTATRLPVVDEQRTEVDVAGIDGVDVRLAAGDVRIVYDDVDTATFDSTSSDGVWRYGVEGSRLVIVGEPIDRFTIFDWGFAEQSATLTLPESLEGLDLDIDMDAGRFTADGSFGDVTYDIAAGMIELEGSAESVDGTMDAGMSVVELADVRTAAFDVSAGRFDGTFEGEAPEHVEIDVTAGSFDLGLPDEPYRVSVDREAGSVESHLEESRSSDRTVDVTVTAGHVTLFAR